MLAGAGSARARLRDRGPARPPALALVVVVVVVVVVVLVLARGALRPLVFVFFVGGPTRDRLVPVLEAGREGGARDEFSGSS